ncbi:MAG TPA: hypothetical protein VHG33_04365 [Woeseiaceae bacterium]|nr:hypothetical protein [Woeseiaceae bacterium]
MNATAIFLPISCLPRDRFFARIERLSALEKTNRRDMIPAHLYGLNQFLGINWRFGGPQTWPDSAAVPDAVNACASQAIREHCFRATTPRAG